MKHHQRIQKGVDALTDLATIQKRAKDNSSAVAIMLPGWKSDRDIDYTMQMRELHLDSVFGQ